MDSRVRGNNGWVLTISRICQHYLDTVLLQGLDVVDNVPDIFIGQLITQSDHG